MLQRIGLLFEYPTLNGGERSMLQSLGLIDSGEFELIALAPGRGRLAEQLRAQSVRHIPFELRDADGLRLPRDTAGRQLIETAGRHGITLLHANSLSMGRLTGSVVPSLAVPCVAHLRDIIGLSRAAIDDLNRNQALIAVSRATRDFHVARGLSPDRTRVIHNGVDCERFCPRPKTYSLCRELQVPESSFVIMTIGQIGLRKGQDMLAAAAPHIARHVPGVQFVMVGERNSSKAETISFEGELTDTFRRTGLADQFHGLGYREDVNRLVNEADLLVHPAKQEPLGRVLLEAAAAGLPIVATDVGGTSEIIADGSSGRLVAPGDAPSLAAAVVELATDSPLRNRFAAAARQRVAREFTPRAAANNLMQTWRAIRRT